MSSKRKPESLSLASELENEDLEYKLELPLIITIELRDYGQNNFIGP